MKISIPKEVSEISAKLAAAGFEIYLVGGCVRDMLLDREPKDWDVTTNAKPEEIQALFPESVYENDFGTVFVKTKKEDTVDEQENHDSQSISGVELTTYRIEGKYSDQRHPDDVKFAKTIEEDLSRRDFTVNAIAMNLKGEIVDPFEGRKDLKAKMIRTVGEPEERFAEDPLRLMRAARFAAQLDFELDPATRAGIKKHSQELEVIAKERIRDELTKILMTPRALKGIVLLEVLGLLSYVLPELREGLGVAQNKHHIYTVFEHNLRALDYAASKNYSLEVRMASLLHDVGKPRAKKGDGPDATFYQHEYIGAKMVVKILDRLRFSREFIEKVAHLVRRHMFFYDVGTVTPAGVRRFIVRVGPENIDDLIKVREADRIGSGVEQAVPYRLRHFLFMIEKVKHDPITPKMLAINGDDLMAWLQLPEGMRIGWILHSLLEEVLDDPEKNVKNYLTARAEQLNKLSDAELRELTIQARKKEKEAEAEAEAEIKKEFHVK
jgi:poly(A) polymerase/tRNA nucleotidyltransferase (CCA-adding enzyme)